MLRAIKILQRFRGSGDANNHDVGIGGSLANGIAGNAGKVRFRTVCGEYHDVMGFVADNDLKVCGKGRIIPNPHAELGIGGDYDFVRDDFTGKSGYATCPLREEGIRQCQGFVFCQTKIAVLGINEEQNLAGR